MTYDILNFLLYLNFYDIKKLCQTNAYACFMPVDQKLDFFFINTNCWVLGWFEIIKEFVSKKPVFLILPASHAAAIFKISYYTYTTDFTLGTWIAK